MKGHRNNRNKANNGGKWIRPEKRSAIYSRDDCKCVYCGKPMDGRSIFTLDHLLPCELGGSNEAKNLVTCCKRCNSRKKALSVRDFLAVLAKEGKDTEEIRKRIRRNTRRKLKDYRERPCNEGQSI